MQPFPAAFPEKLTAKLKLSPEPSYDPLKLVLLLTPSQLLKLLFKANVLAVKSILPVTVACSPLEQCTCCSVSNDPADVLTFRDVDITSATVLNVVNVSLMALPVPVPASLLLPELLPLEPPQFVATINESIMTEYEQILGNFFTVFLLATS